MKTLILGSTVVDVILRLPRLPRSQESCNIYHQELRLGGCAFNASEALRRFGADYTPVLPRRRRSLRGLCPPGAGEAGGGQPHPRA